MRIGGAAHITLLSTIGRMISECCAQPRNTQMTLAGAVVDRVIAQGGMQAGLGEHPPPRAAQPWLLLRVLPSSLYTCCCRHCLQTTVTGHP